MPGVSSRLFSVFPTVFVMRRTRSQLNWMSSMTMTVWMLMAISTAWTRSCTLAVTASGYNRSMMINRLVHLDVEGTSEELLHQLSYAIKNQLVTSKAPY